MPFIRQDLFHGWSLEDDGVDVLLTGPGALKIVLLCFDPTWLTHDEGLPPVLIGSLRQLGWTYLLERPADGFEHSVKLSLTLTWDLDAPDSPMQGRLRLGHYVTWQLPSETGQALGDWFARQEEHRPVPPAGL